MLTKTTQPSHPAGNTADQEAQKTSKAPSTERAEAFRKRLAEGSMTRWEIMASDKTRAEVRAIARIEGMSPGLAAEALLSLGVEAYHRSPSEEEMLPERPQIHAAAVPLGVNAAVVSGVPVSLGSGAYGLSGVAGSRGADFSPIASAHCFFAQAGSHADSSLLDQFDQQVMRDGEPKTLASSLKDHGALVVKSSMRTLQANQSISATLISTHPITNSSGLKKLASYSSRPTVETSKNQAIQSNPGTDKTMSAFFDKAKKRNKGGGEQKE